MDQVRHKECVDAGVEWWLTIEDEERHDFAEARRQAWTRMDEEKREKIMDILGMDFLQYARFLNMDIVGINRETNNAVRTEQAEERYGTEGSAVIVPDNLVWNCGGCDLECSKRVDIYSFAGVSDFVMFKWMVAHKLIDVSCHARECNASKCRPIALGESVGLKCDMCGYKSKGGKLGLWEGSNLGHVSLMMVVFGISCGFSFIHLTDHTGFKLNKNTWTRFIKLIGYVAAETLEKARKDPANKWANAQFNKTAFGRR